MTAPVTTLAESITIQTEDGVGHRRDVLVTVHDRTGRHTHVVVTSPGLTIDLTLSGAERIALIEALGGTVAS